MGYDIFQKLFIMARYYYQAGCTPAVNAAVDCDIDTRLVNFMCSWPCFFACNS